MSFNPVTDTSPDAPRGPLPPSAASVSPAAAVWRSAPAAHELPIWLAALPSFFDLKNHPLIGDDAERYLSKDYAPETRVLRQALRRCLHLCLLQSPEPDATRTPGGDFTLDDPDLNLFDQPDDPADSSLPAPVWESLSELYLCCRALSLAPRVDFTSWSGLAAAATRAIAVLDPLPVMPDAQPSRALARRLPRVARVFESDAERACAAEVAAVLSAFAHCLEQLAFVGDWLAKDRPIKLTLPIFAHVRATARAASSTLEEMARRAAEGGGEHYELYDSAAYAVRMELNKVFGHELVGLAAARLAPTVYTRVENAHGLLRDCFQQTIITLALAFDPRLDPAAVFDTQLARLQNSLRLREDLWTLGELVRRAERDCGRKPLAPLVARLQEFQQGSMRHLMYKDWESFERFASEVSAARGAVELGPVLHRFATYLDALFNQINMRAALAAYPFTPPLLAD